MLLSLLAAATWLPAVLGLGLLVPLRVDEEVEVAVRGFAGLAALGLAAQVASLAVPVSGGLDAALWVAGTLAFAARRHRLPRPGRAAALALAVALAGLAFLAQDPYFVYDTGLYHLPSVTWLTGERVVPGLANLHGRLGFNSAWFAVAAALEHPWLAGKSAFVLNMLPPLLGGTAAWAGSRRLLAGDRRAGTALLALLWIPVAEGTLRVGSLKPDSATSLLFFLSVALLVRGAERAGEGSFAGAFRAAALLAAFALTLKLSAAVLPALVVAFAVVFRRALGWREAAVAAGLAAALVVPWLARNLLLSGCLAYPAAFTCFPSLPWSVPPSQVRQEAAWIRSWAHLYGAAQDAVPPFAEWIGPWLRRMARATVVRISLALLLVGLWGTLRRRGAAPAPGLGLAGLGVAAALAYWLASAPDPGYATGVLFLAGALPVAAAVSRGGLSPRWGLVASAACALSLAVGPFTSATDWKADEFHLLRWPALPAVEVRERVTDSGLRIRVPVKGDQCWATPRPCTPYFRPDLVRDGGFRVAGTAGAGR